MQPQVGVGVVILDGENVVLIKRGKPPKMGEWSLPGGRVEFGETLHDAALREVAEETGLNVIIQSSLDVVELIEIDSVISEQFHYVLVDFWAVPATGILKADDDAAEAAWYSVSEIGNLGLWPKTIDMIHKAKQLQKLSAQL